MKLEFVGFTTSIQQIVDALAEIIGKILNFVAKEEGYITGGS